MLDGASKASFPVLCAIDSAVAALADGLGVELVLFSDVVELGADDVFFGEGFSS